jgi:hypothetical protein
MPQAAEAKEKPVISQEQYQGLFTPPLVLPLPGELFDYEVEKLVGHGLATYSDADLFRKRLPERGLILLVPPPPSTLDLDHLMSLVEWDGRTGENHLDSNLLVPLIDVPLTATLLIGVDDGRQRLNTRPAVSRLVILAENRDPYGLWHGIIHAILFPMVLNHHWLNLVGTGYDENLVPRLCLRGGRPSLAANFDDRAFAEWGTPSASHILVP